LKIPNLEMEDAVGGDGKISLQELEGARQTVRLCSGLSRQELARTICEHWGWVTASGSHKVTACLKVLEKWEHKGLLRLPGKRSMRRWSTDQACGAVPTQRTNPAAPRVGELSQMGPVWLEVVKGTERGRLWNEYVDRYHYLGYRQPVGCALRYFVLSPAGVLGCVLMAGAAKGIQARDQWIGWDSQRRQQNLPWVINNTRLLIFPWVRIPQLGSHVLGQLARGVGQDWQERWGYGPLLMETFVDPAKFSGTCYRSAGWIPLARTTGRGLPRAGQVYLSTPKIIYVKGLCADFRERLCGGPLPGRVEP
jgi:Druantia protein DruA